MSQRQVSRVAPAPVGCPISLRVGVGCEGARYRNLCERCCPHGATGQSSLRSHGYRQGSAGAHVYMSAQPGWWRRREMVGMLGRRMRGQEARQAPHPPPWGALLNHRSNSRVPDPLGNKPYPYFHHLQPWTKFGISLHGGTSAQQQWWQDFLPHCPHGNPRSLPAVVHLLQSWRNWVYPLLLQNIGRAC